jgi:hypothetical protein
MHVHLSYKGLSHKGIIARYNDNGVYLDGINPEYGEI